MSGRALCPPAPPDSVGSHKGCPYWDRRDAPNASRGDHKGRPYLGGETPRSGSGQTIRTYFGSVMRSWIHLRAALRDNTSRT